MSDQGKPTGKVSPFPDPWAREVELLRPEQIVLKVEPEHVILEQEKGKGTTRPTDGE